MQHHLLVENIVCYGCAEAIEAAVAWVPGVERVQVEIANRTVWFDGDRVLLPRVVRVLERLGFPLRGSVDSVGLARASVLALGSCEIGRRSGQHGTPLPPPPVLAELLGPPVASVPRPSVSADEDTPPPE